MAGVFCVSPSLFFADPTHGTGKFAVRLYVLLILSLIPSTLFPLWYFPDVAPTVLLFAARHSWGGSHGKSEDLAMSERMRGIVETAPTCRSREDGKCGSRACAVQPHLAPTASLSVYHPASNALALRQCGSYRSSQKFGTLGKAMVLFMSRNMCSREWQRRGP
ncbi:hypothetical protein CPAR01_06594 [Colletotrichum paranaense]|uniref:Uncharacterized protein n=2 Tax=Colletotrichum acutatum species complex TaxID=2707335 RepID=A0AAI9XY88_9PEZI|nr:uncharacterized protein CPAR01_06594 [Colletotrichum paranaense]KAK1468521.1 hypothetical protein CMEL01_00288 [Colletotrichum melonis]KAK1540605.1 hypothetical protein CPAR01_06594 [Colletotrichum paranaense]